MHLGIGAMGFSPCFQIKYKELLGFEENFEESYPKEREPATFSFACPRLHYLSFSAFISSTSGGANLH
jgi:hypothetical protein